MSRLQRNAVLLLLLLRKVTSDGIIRLHLTKRDVLLGNSYDSFLTVPVGVDDQNLRFVVDTGSFKTFVISDRTIWNGKPCKGTNFGLYECNQPVCDDKPMKGSFVDGTKTEIVRHKGTLKLGDQIVSRVEFGIVKNFTDPQGVARSLLGLGLKSSPGYPVAFLDQLYTKRVIQSREFSIYFNPENENEGELLLGESDPTKYDGELVPLPLTDGSKWEVKLDSMKIDGISILETSYPIIFDSGTDFLVVPKKVSDAIVARIGNSATAAGGQVELSDNGLLRLLGCKGRTHLPDIELTFRGLSGGDNFTLRIPQEFYLGQLPGGDCVLLITAIPGYMKFIVAITFLRHYYMDFNKDEHQIRIGNITKTPQIDATSHANLQRTADGQRSRHALRV